jgi:hypothetical protein
MHLSTGTRKRSPTHNPADFLPISSRSVSVTSVPAEHERDTISMQNRSNFDAHFAGTGPEIWRQTNGEVSAFVAGAGPPTAVSSMDRSDPELG